MQKELKNKFYSKKKQVQQKIDNRISVVENESNKVKAIFGPLFINKV